MAASAIYIYIYIQQLKLIVTKEQLEEAMEIINNHSLLILMISSSLLIISLLFPAAATATEPPVASPDLNVVKSLCDPTPNAPHCNSFISDILKNDKTISTSHDPAAASILMACINRCIHETKLALNKAPTCPDSYQSTHYFLSEALAGFKTKALDQIQSKLAVARGDSSTTCIEDLDVVTDDVDPSIIQTTESLQKMIVTCEDIAATAKIF